MVHNAIIKFMVRSYGHLKNQNGDEKLDSCPI